MRIPLFFVGGVIGFLVFPDPKPGDNVMADVLLYCGVGGLIGLVLDFYFWRRSRSIANQAGNSK